MPPASGAAASSGPEENAYRCHCSASFSRIENLVRHAKIHAAERKWQCQSCDKAFTRPDLLKRHAQIHQRQASVSSNMESVETGRKRRRSNDSNERLVSPRWAPAPSEGQVVEGSGPLSSPGPLVPAGLLQSAPGSARAEPDVFRSQAATTNLDMLVDSAVEYDPVDPVLSGMVASQRLIWDAIGGRPVLDDSPVWDSGMHWILDDLAAYQPTWQEDTSAHVAALDTYNRPDLLSEGVTSYAVDGNLLQSLLTELQSQGSGMLPMDPPRSNGRARDAVSRAVSPPPDGAVDEDKWPMNWRPAGQTVRLGAGAFVPALASADDIGAGLQRWKHMWIGHDDLIKVKNSFSLAMNSPGADISAFKMPASLHTVNLFLSLYFESFEPQMRILHLPTFKTREAPPLLIAALIMIGANYSSLEGARAFAVDLIEVLRKTLNALFEVDARNLRSMPLIQVYFLVMLAGLWCGSKRTYELAEASRGTLINLMRRAELLHCGKTTSRMRGEDDLDHRWRQWISAESRKRLGFAICLIDVIFPAVLDIPAYHSQADMIRSTLPSDDRYWTAPNARVWAATLGTSESPSTPFFTSGTASLMTPASLPPEQRIPPMVGLNDFSALVLIASLHHHIYEFRTQLSLYLSAGMRVPLLYGSADDDGIGPGFEGRRQWLTEALDVWKDHYYDTWPASPQMDSARVLWHLGHISLNVQIASLYTASGRKGREMARAERIELAYWAKMLDARVAVRHSLALLRLLSGGSRGSIYYPTAAFVASLCVWAFVKETDTGADAREVLVEVDAFLQGHETLGAEPTKPNAAQVLERGARILAAGKAWRIGAAFALVLASCAEQEGARVGEAWHA